MSEQPWSEWTLEMAKRAAFKDADQKIEDGKFIPMGTDYDWDNKENYIDGDPENIETLTSLYGQELSDHERDLLHQELSERYPAYSQTTPS